MHSDPERAKRLGSAGGKQPSNCSTCAGRGQVLYRQGLFSVPSAYPACRGAGRVVTDPCSKCRGEARVMHEHKIEVTVPAGVEDGMRIRHDQQGDAGLNGGPAGDLYVVLRVKPHSFFEREGKDLYCSIPISFAQAALGAEIMIPTLEGEHRLKVPEGTQSGTIFRIRSKGVTSVKGGGKGDLHVQVKVITPARLTKRQRELLTELAGASEIENKPEPRGLFEKVKDIFG